MRPRVAQSIIVLAFGVIAGTMCGQDSSADPARRSLSAAPHSNEIHVDQNCRIYETAPHSGGTKQHVYTDRGICDVGDGHDYSRDETDIDDGRRKHRTVEIKEHTFTLHNPSTEPVVFVVDHVITKGWQIDSDPQPNRVEGTTARFLIFAQPGETVSLHVGERNPPK